jgi:hypothetical protein
MEYLRSTGVPSLPIADGIERAAQTFADNDRMAASESM